MAVIDFDNPEANDWLAVDQFKPWRTIGGREDAPASAAELQVVLEGVFDKRRFLDSSKARGLGALNPSDFGPCPLFGH